MKHPLFYSRLLWLTFALVVTWIMLILTLSWFYVRALTHTACPAGIEELPGYTSVSLPHPEGLEQPAWWRPPENGAVVILLGGHLSTRDSMLAEASILASRGYGVLLPSSRGCSGGRSSLGARESADVDAALGYISSQAPSAWIGVMGFSAGGVAAIRGSVSHPEVRAIVAQGNYANLWWEIQAANPSPFSLEWQLQRAAALLLWAQLGVPPASVSPIDDLPRLSPRPVLLIHGEREIGRTRGFDQFAAACEPKQLWVVPGADHGEYFAAAPGDYARHIVEFFDTWRTSEK